MKRELQTHKVLRNQLITPDCVVCGTDNPISLHAQFCDLDDGSTLCIFETKFEYQSFPDRLHGGMLGMIMDELLNRAAMATNPRLAGVTMDLSLKYRAPVPLNEKLMAIAWLEKDRSRVFDATGQIVLPDGTIAVEATGRFLKIVTEKLEAGEYEDYFIEDSRPFPETVLI